MRLVQRMSQRVVMTPLLQQAIHLLQLSTLELKEVVGSKVHAHQGFVEAPRGALAFYTETGS